MPLLSPPRGNVKYVIVFVAMIWFLPTVWQSRMIGYALNRRGRTIRIKGNWPECIHKGMHSVINPYCLSNSSYLAHKAMRQVSI